MYDKYKFVQVVRSNEAYKNYGVILVCGGKREMLAAPLPPFQVSVVITAENGQMEIGSYYMAPKPQQANNKGFIGEEKAKNQLISDRMKKELITLGVSCGTAAGGVALAVPTGGLSAAAAVAGAWQCGVSIGRVLNESNVSSVLSDSNNDIIDEDTSTINRIFGGVNTLADLIQIISGIVDISKMFMFAKFLGKYPKLWSIIKELGIKPSKAKVKKVIAALFPSKEGKMALIAEIKTFLKEEQLTTEQWQRLSKTTNSNKLKVLIHGIHAKAMQETTSLMSGLNTMVNMGGSWYNGLIGASGINWVISIEKSN